MRVLHIITSLNDGGAEAVLYRLVSHNYQDMHHVLSLTGEGKYGSLLRQIGIEVTALEMPRGYVTVRGLLQLWRVVKSWHANSIQTWMPHANLLGGIVGKLLGVPVVWGLHSVMLDPKYSAGTTIWVMRMCALLSHWVPTRIVVCANAALRAHVKMGYDLSRMVVIPNGYDLSHFAPDVLARERLRKEWGVGENVPVIGMVARFDPQKNHENLIRALGDLLGKGVEFQVVLVGTGLIPENRDIATWIAEVGLGKRIRLIGPTHEVPAVMNALDVHVLSSAYGEAFPNVLAEAMACGTPCVTTDVGDAALIVGDTGWVVSPKNSEALAQALQCALAAWQNRSSWAQRRSACRARIAENFSLDVMVQQYQQVWSQIKGFAEKGGNS